jgi:hypothetical protein
MRRQSAIPWPSLRTRYFVHATIACNKNYMDSAIGVDVHNRALECHDVLTAGQQGSIIKKAFLMFEADAKKFGKAKACHKVDDIWKAGTITPAQCDSRHC